MRKHTHQHDFCAICQLDELAKLLPHQGPIKDFIHQNTLSAFIDEPFDDAVKHAGQLFRARSYMDLPFYRQKFSVGEIETDHLEEALDANVPDQLKADIPFFRHALHNYKVINSENVLLYLAGSEGVDKEDIRHKLAAITAKTISQTRKTKIIRDLIIREAGPDFEHEVHQIFFRLLGSFVDQGVSLWPYLNDGSSFTDAIRVVVDGSFLPLKAWIDNHELSHWLKIEPVLSIPKLLAKIIGDQSLYADYLQELLLAHSGWSGMVNVISHRPQSLSKPCNIDLEQITAVKLALEYQFIKHRTKGFRPISLEQVRREEDHSYKAELINSYSIVWLLISYRHNPSPEAIALIDSLWLEKIWHQALENAYYLAVAKALTSSDRFLEKKSKKTSFQAVFCIDDRECSFRRILEGESDAIETFSTAGFFGIDSYLKSSNNLPQQICPAPLSPQYVIKELPNSEKTKNDSLVELATFITRHGANSTILGFVSAYTIGHLSLLSLMASFFRPWSFFQSSIRAKSIKQSPILFERQEESPKDGDLFVGYTHQEMADRVFNTLKNMGMTGNFAPLVLIIGHGSSSVNNPHFAAYDCGACSGRPGAVNARVFAAMANKPEVRHRVSINGMMIPDDTVFVAAFHDTSMDRIDFLDTDELDRYHQQLLTELERHIAVASQKNAQERCRKFALVPKNISLKKAYEEVRHRATALFEPRPELNHATNALLVVGRRMRSHGANLNRRAFLQSYDPNQDMSGAILNAILSALVPVCGGINLEYYFSRVDPAVYGCGSKLSHNVCSLIGVGNGLDDDLRTGLPVQMTEVHDPVRLLIVVEQDESVIKNIINNNLDLKPWINNQWMKIAALDPTGHRLTLYDPDKSSWQVMGISLC